MLKATRTSTLDDILLFTDRTDVYVVLIDLLMESCALSHLGLFVNVGWPLPLIPLIYDPTKCIFP